MTKFILGAKKTMYDVIVTGAGPTGSSAAKKLSDDGYKVLIVERFKLPRSKSCSGLLIQKSMDLVSSYFRKEIPKSVMCLPHDNRGMIFTDDNGREHIYEQPGLNIWRSSFDQWLTERAVIAGAELRDETAAIAYEEQNDGVIVTLKGESEYSEKARIVIACDGVTSTAKRKLTNAPKDYITTYQTFNNGSIDLDPHYFYAYLQPEYSEYDAWFNVKDDYLIFGVAVRDTTKIEHYYSAFVNYMKSRHDARISKQEKSEKWIMPRVVPGCPIDYGKGKVLFAGEAAGFLNPMGEGISCGLECGHIAAETISRFDLHGEFDIEAVYSDYQKNTSDIRFYMERQWRFVAHVSNRFSHMKY
jgi:flavin-dependent dehydrogenase